MTDYMATFAFGRGFQNKTPKQTGAIVPSRLKRIWERDNDKRVVTWEMAQQGGVSGDCFVKVAYEEPVDDPRIPPTLRRGKVRILPLNSQHCFPEWAPHDRNRLIRFKLTYKFWGSSPEGTRQVYTYTEIITDNLIQEFINDQMIRENENPLGTIPVVHIPNVLVSGSPWGLPDCYDILSINRDYNEKATEIGDIINYHAAPITVVLGAKVNNLERGAKKIWALPGQNVDVKNLELGANLQGPMEFLDRLKLAMHEMTGIPETALGQAQPISNTSGVALAIQFQPLMMKWHAKVNQYAAGIERINELALLTLFLKEPQTLVYDPDEDGPIDIEGGQVEILDPEDPMTYETEVFFPSPLPIDEVILLNNLLQKQTMGLESREGMLGALGEEFPKEKLEEIRREQVEDAKADGALQLLRTMIQKQIVDLTGLMPGADGAAELPPMDDGAPDALGQTTPSPQTPEPVLDAAAFIEEGIEEKIRTDLVTQAYGPRVPMRRKPDQKPEGEARDD